MNPHTKWVTIQLAAATIDNFITSYLVFGSFDENIWGFKGRAKWMIFIKVGSEAVSRHSIQPLNLCESVCTRVPAF